MHAPQRSTANQDRPTRKTAANEDPAPGMGIAAERWTGAPVVLPPAVGERGVMDRVVSPAMEDGILDEEEG